MGDFDQRSTRSSRDQKNAFFALGLPTRYRETGLVSLSGSQTSTPRHWSQPAHSSLSGNSAHISSHGRLSWDWNPQSLPPRSPWLRANYDPQGSLNPNDFSIVPQVLVFYSLLFSKFSHSLFSNALLSYLQMAVSVKIFFLLSKEGWVYRSCLIDFAVKVYLSNFSNFSYKVPEEISFRHWAYVPAFSLKPFLSVLWLWLPCSRD